MLDNLQNTNASSAMTACVVLALSFPFAEVAAQQQPVLSFGVQPKNDNRDAENQASENEILLSFNFRFAPWTDVLKLFAETAGLTLDLRDEPPETFSYFDKGKYTPTEALDILNGYLLPRGYVLVRRDNFLVSLNINKEIPPNVIPVVPVEELASRGKNTLLSTIFALQHGDSTQVAAEVRELLGPQGKVVALKASNSLIVTDIGSNLRMIDTLFKQQRHARLPSGTGGQAFRAFVLKNITAAEAERTIRKLFGLPDERSSRNSAGGAVPPAAGVPPTRMKLTTDPRTNRLFVSTVADEMRLVEQMIEDLDVRSEAVDSSNTGFERKIEVIVLGRTSAGQVGQVLGSLSPRIRVSVTGESPRPAGSPVPPKREPPGDERGRTKPRPNQTDEPSTSDNPAGRPAAAKPD